MLGRLSAAAELDLSTFLDQLSPDVPSSTNQATQDVAFQRWFRVKEAFSPLFVRDVVESMPRRPATCLDPCGGSGTTALTCQFLNIEPATVEVNPFLADLIEAKLTTYRAEAVARDREHLRQLIASGPVDLDVMFADGPPTLYEPGRNGRWIFDRDVMRRIAQYRQGIDRLVDDAHRRLFRIILGSTLVHLSNVVVNGKGRRYRGGWNKKHRRAADVDIAFQVAFENALFDIERLPSRANKRFTLLRGDSRQRLADLAGPYDLILFSPPYPNSFDYTDIYNIELWALGYLTSSSDNRDLRNATLRSHVQIKRDSDLPQSESQTLNGVLEALQSARDRLWSRQIPGMIGSYFADLAILLEHCARMLSDEGRIALVVGDSRYADVVVPVAGILAELGTPLGLEVIEKRSLRPMRASAQQGGTMLLSEDLLVFRRGH